MGFPRPRRVTVIVLLVFLSVIVMLGSLLEARVYEVSEVSPSPLNPLPSGTQLFYHDLSRAYRVVLGGPEDIGRLEGRILYLVIGPDKPFAREEASIIAGYLSNGKIGLLVADETGKTSVLLEELGVPGLGGVVVNESAVGEWAYVVPVECAGVGGVSTLVVEVAGGEPVCYSLGRPVGSLYAGGRVLVLGDSSIFANYLYGGEYPYLPSTRDLAWAVLDVAGAGDYDVVLWDNKHYSYRAGRLGSGVMTRLAGAILSEMQGVGSSLESVEPERLVLYLLAASLPWPVILLFPSRRERPVVDEAADFEAWLVGLEAERIGAKLPGAPLGRDPSRVARRLLGVAGGGDDKGEDSG